MGAEVSELLAVRYAESVMKECMVFQGGSEDKDYPISFTIYLLKTKNKLILVDVGCDTFPGFDMRNHRKPVDVLKEYGYSADDITDVVITHAHYDHIAAIHYYPKAMVHIQLDEYLNGKRYIPKGFQVKTFEKEATIDNCVVVKNIGGHSIGSCIVLFEKEDKTYVISGDECYSQKCFSNQIPTGASICPQKSREFIEKFGDEKYYMLIEHDINAIVGKIY